MLRVVDAHNVEPRSKRDRGVRQMQSKTLHPCDEVLPSGKLLTLALKHVLVMYAGAVEVPL
ncbi:purine permease, partial [Burkholderia thailandensis]|nr:purine permease [Burkholderia thailandensis]